MCVCVFLCAKREVRVSRAKFFYVWNRKSWYVSVCVRFFFVFHASATQLFARGAAIYGFSAVYKNKMLLLIFFFFCSVRFAGKTALIHSSRKYLADGIHKTQVVCACNEIFVTRLLLAPVIQPPREVSII